MDENEPLVCHDWLFSNCRFKDNCRYNHKIEKHNLSENRKFNFKGIIKVPICKKEFLNGSCTFKKCTLNHFNLEEILSERDLNYLKNKYKK